MILGEFVYDRVDFENFLGVRHKKFLTVSKKDGSVYMGEWKGKKPKKKDPIPKNKIDKRHGRGFLFYKSGGIYEGYFMDD